MRSIWRDTTPPFASPLKFFLFASKPHWRSACLASALVIAAGVLQASIPYLYKIITEGVIALAEGNAQPVLLGVCIYIAVSLTAHVLWRGSGFAGSFWATGVRATGRDALFAHLSQHSYQYFSNRFAGSLLSKIKQAADGSRDLVSAFLWDILTFVVAFVVSTAVIFSTSLVGGFVLLALLLVVLPFNIFFVKKRIPLSMAAQEAETVLNGATVDAITNVTTVHEYANRDFETERLRELTLNRRRLGMRNWQFGEWILMANGIFVHVFTAALMLGSIYLVVQGEAEPGDVVLFLATAWLLEGYFVHLSQQFDRISESWGQIKESLADVLAPHEVTNAEETQPFSLGNSSITFQNVTFAYGETTLFENLSFKIAPGEKVGIVGKSGAGKSTLMKLILRHYDLTNGTISVGNSNVSLVAKEHLRRSLALVPQEPSLFHRTIHDNIAYARPTATREEVIEAAKLAEAHEFIATLPEGYESLVGERGVKLSGGQRQRIAIARAILKDAPILLLDEATSALDSESELKVQHALASLMKGRTVLAIAHRLSTLRAMDRIIVFEKGRIVEDGTHEELLKAEGIYADLWRHQAGGFITEDGE